MNRHFLKTLVHLAPALLLILPLTGTFTTSSAYYGSMSSTDACILGSGNWFHTGPITLAWTITRNPDDTWHYLYTFCHPAGETTFFILETSPTFCSDNIFNWNGDFREIEIGLHPAGLSCPGMPASVYGIRFDQAHGLQTNIWFDSDCAPVWGDFYSKDGTDCGHGVNAAWNRGFTQHDWDPSVCPGGGAYECHLLVPDTGLTPIPEPTSLLLLGLGAVVLAIRRQF